LAPVTPIAGLEITTIAELGTAAGTLVLAIATFAATRSANRSARIAERSMLIGLRPTLVVSRPEDRTERVDFAGGGGGSRAFDLPGGTAIVVQEGGISFFAISLRNVGTGAAMIHGWHMQRGFLGADVPHRDPDQFRPQRRDLYISPGDTGFWQGAVREASDPLNEEVRAAMTEGDWLIAELLYSDQEIGRRFISRFSLRLEDDHWYPVAGRHWTLDY
jgi:hypothetical protein